jgi:hypothetical protein
MESTFANIPTEVLYEHLLKKSGSIASISSRLPGKAFEPEHHN